MRANGQLSRAEAGFDCIVYALFCREVSQRAIACIPLCALIICVEGSSLVGLVPETDFAICDLPSRLLLPYRRRIRYFSENAWVGG